MKKKLKHLLEKVNVLEIIGDSLKWIEGISMNSKTVKKNMIFVANKGKRIDGHQFIMEAIQKGATAIICEKKPFLLHKSVTYILVPNSTDSLGVISSNFYDHPTKKIKLVGITGTNGKTSVATILHHLFYKMGEKSILISTMGIKILLEEFYTIYPHTTPNIIEINKYLNLSIQKKCKYAFMEVSSHGIHQKRISGLLFTGGVFTNITHDHLDYHKSFENYLSTKRDFFEKFLHKNSFALINSDDKNSHKIIRNVLSKTYFYGVKKKADYNIEILEKNIHGNNLMINGQTFFTRLIGEFNVYNLLASYATAMLLGKKEHEILKIIKTIQPIKGRFEQFVSHSERRIIVDYAHNPDGLKNVLNTIKKMKKQYEKLICVIGCGGNRDRKKRSLMGKRVYETCDISIFTSDNPREEDPNQILKDMKKFRSYLKKSAIITVINRKKAIQTAIQISKKKDIILIAGKGHENYQEIKGKRYPFDDMQIVKTLLK
ncbi:UDP-N-acetylmuramoyl-L-alanyl-D-glutamate--2,6-diaminopimelate ligase [Blattabacterium cuenoti]|uniref:UDP-N-acetylmuramoyl-L-alanyl-D-glutamate--2, 6-diaminopimelate ligase n=1 Tax=Blattabacterium cuenoti TaxID=1653831 RepID=UPI00163C526E|nr:UDP-N-acetylmuramoyl-L-alanyl-D-glutamate--2,6-diaminopimelate ligase [Blattabacterium cuenoti]